MNGFKLRQGLAAVLIISFSSFCIAQQDQININAALVEAESNTEPLSLPVQNWWDKYTMETMGTNENAIMLDINQLVFMTIKNSAQVKVFSDVPLIRETAVQEAAAAFDWTKFAETKWRDISEPVGSSLTVGGTGDRFLDEQWTGSAGIRRKTLSGGQLEVSQQIGWQDTNSTFFVPNDQGTARLTLGFTQPLLRGRGQAYNRSLVVLANIDVDTANKELERQLQSQLMEVVRGYWALYLERASLSQKVILYSKTKQIVEQLTARQKVDAARTQLVSAEAALENRRSDLIRARAAVENAETRLRALINAEELQGDTEFIPLQPPTFQFFETSQQVEIETAIQNRPEIAAALKEIRAGCIRLGMAQHEMLPQLNLITQAYVAGIQGNSDLGQAWSSQFTEGSPSYSLGLQYEVPIGRRASTARKQRRQIEIRQLRQQYQSALENIKAEVEVAVRELHTSYREMLGKHRSMESASVEAATIEARWARAVDAGTAGLNLESLLRAQERLTESEFEYLTAQLTYNLSMMNLRRANGTLLQTERVNFNKNFENGIPKLEFDQSNHSALQKESTPDPSTIPQHASPQNAIQRQADAKPTSSKQSSSSTPKTIDSRSMIVPPETNQSKYFRR